MNNIQQWLTNVNIMKQSSWAQVEYPRFDLGRCLMLHCLRWESELTRENVLTEVKYSTGRQVIFKFYK